MSVSLENSRPPHSHSPRVLSVDGSWMWWGRQWGPHRTGVKYVTDLWGGCVCDCYQWVQYPHASHLLVNQLPKSDLYRFSSHLFRCQSLPGFANKSTQETLKTQFVLCGFNNRWMNIKSIFTLPIESSPLLVKSQELCSHFLLLRHPLVHFTRILSAIVAFICCTCNNMQRDYQCSQHISNIGKLHAVV